MDHFHHSQRVLSYTATGFFTPVTMPSSMALPSSSKKQSFTPRASNRAAISIAPFRPNTCGNHRGTHQVKPSHWEEHWKTSCCWQCPVLQCKECQKSPSEQLQSNLSGDPSQQNSLGTINGPVADESISTLGNALIHTLLNIAVNPWFLDTVIHQSHELHKSVFLKRY